MKWRIRFLWMKARPVVTFALLVAVPFAPVVPWILTAGPEPPPLPADGVAAGLLSFALPIPKGAAVVGTNRGPSIPPVDPAGVRRASRGWEVRSIDGGAWKLLMSRRFAVRGDIRADDLRAVAAYAEVFLDAVHERLRGDLTDLRLSIRVFADEEEFRHWASCREVEAATWFYDRRGGEIALLFGPATEVSDFCGRLMKGVALEYLDRALEFSGPDRIATEVSEWFADYAVVKSRVVPRRPRGDAGSWIRIAEPGPLEAAWRAWAGGD